MNYFRKIISVVLAAVILGTTVPNGMMTVSASENVQEETTDSEVTETTGEANLEETEQEGVSENVEHQTEYTEAQNDPTVNDETETDTVGEKVISDSLVNYVYVELPYLESPSVQTIAVSFGDGTEEISNAALFVKDSQGNSSEFSLTRQEENIYIFEKEFSTSESGVYYISGFSYTEKGITSTVDFQNAGIEAVFGVDEYYPGYDETEVPAADEEELEEAVVDVEVDDLDNVEEKIESALEDTSEDLGTVTTARGRSYATSVMSDDDDVVVVLDPGHGKGDPGAAGNGVDENTINYKIATYCKQELEEYAGVSVYLTRDMTTNPSIYERVQIAKGYGADVLVSLHNNSSTSSSAHGAEVWYPHENYNQAVGQQGEKLAQNIQNQLVALGLADRGIHVKYTVNDKYPDGSTQDWYGIIRYSKEAGFPGIIVEHAFVSNAGDVSSFLNSDEKLQKLGIADATGIANYFGLTKGKSVKIVSKNDFAGTAQIKVSGAGGAANVKIYNEDNAELSKWYALSQGKGTIDFNIKDFENAGGIYHVEVYDANKQELYCETSFRVSSDASVNLTSKSEDDKETVYTFKAKFADMPDEVQGVSFPVWTTSNQSDIRWISAAESEPGTWTADLNISDYKKSGLYNVHAYAILKDGSEQFLGELSFTVTEPSMEVSVENYKKDKGIFDVVIRNVKAPAGVEKIQVPVWCADGQKDLIWHTAKKQEDGSYKATVSMAQHDYLIGDYNIHVYLYANNGLLKTYVAPNLNVKLPNVELSAEDPKGTEVSYDLKVTNMDVLGNLKGVRFAVWSEKNGQDDLVWYDAIRGNQGEWTAEADIAKKHKTAGTYQLHVYAVKADGSQSFAGETTFQVEEPEMKVSVENYEKDKGSFDVVIRDVKAPAGVEKIQVPVWCADGQKDLVWHTAKKQEDGSYKVTVSMAQHDYLIGDYNIHVYLYANNGLLKTYVAPNLNVELPNVDLSAEDPKGTEVSYDLKVTNMDVLGNLKGVRFAVWSEKNGQDDLVWYDATRGNQGEWTAEADIAKKHKTAGTYQLHVYAVKADGSQSFAGETTFQVEEPKMKVSVENYEKDKGSFDVVIRDVKAPAGVEKIQVPVWCADGQKDLVWHTAKKQEDGSYKVTVSMAQHDYLIGDYNIHVYLYANNGVLKTYVAPNLSVSVPDVKLSAKDSSGTEMSYSLSAENGSVLNGVKGVRFAVWSEKNGQDDLVWYDATRGNQGDWTAEADIAKKHKTAGTYQLHIYVIKPDASEAYIGETTFEVTEPSMEVSVENYEKDRGTFDVVIRDVNAPAGVEKIQVPVWCADGQKDLVWHTAEKQKDGSYKVTVSTAQHDFLLGNYNIHVYLYANNGLLKTYVAPQLQVTEIGCYPIMGESTVTVEQMVKYYTSSGATYPSSDLAKGGAETLQQFCQIYLEEAKAEGVRAEVAFAQAMHETGWLKYGGIVQIGQFNFAGLGALDGNAAGNCASFPDVRTGVRAQIQHLKAYASTEALNNTCVDPRFHLVKRGVAPYVEWLGIKENPSGAGWATSENYGYNIVDMIREMHSISKK